MSNKLIDIAKQYVTDINGKTILNCSFASVGMAFRAEYSIEAENYIYIVARIDGTEWVFDYFRQACVFHFITSQIGSQNDEELNRCYSIIKEKIGAISKQECDYLQTKIDYELIPEEDR